MRRPSPIQPHRRPAAPVLAPRPVPGSPFDQGIYNGVSPTTLLAEQAEYPQILAPDDYPIALAANDSATTTIKIDSGHLYVMETWRAQSTGAFLILVRENASQISLMNKPIHSSSFFGTAQRPGFISVYDWAVRPEGGIRTFNIELTDLTGATNTVYLEVWGHRRRDILNPSRSGHLSSS